jgi:hypothetical protein
MVLAFRSSLSFLGARRHKKRRSITTFSFLCVGSSIVALGQRVAKVTLLAEYTPLSSRKHLLKV